MGGGRVRTQGEAVVPSWSRVHLLDLEHQRLCVYRRAGRLGEQLPVLAPLHTPPTPPLLLPLESVLRNPDFSISRLLFLFGLRESDPVNLVLTQQLRPGVPLSPCDPPPTPPPSPPSIYSHPKCSVVAPSPALGLSQSTCSSPPFAFWFPVSSGPRREGSGLGGPGQRIRARLSGSGWRSLGPDRQLTDG